MNAHTPIAIHKAAPAQMRRVDSYIAAHSLELGVPFMTANPQELKRLSGLVTVLPFPTKH